jgi:hypothetical protein
MQKAFCGKYTDTVCHGPGRIFTGFVNTGEDDPGHIHPQRFTDRQLSGAANLDALQLGRKEVQKKGIGLDGETEPCLLSEGILYLPDLAVESVQVKDIAGRINGGYKGL